MSGATFAAGCFWGVEATFREVPGVTATRVGYTGGTVDTPTYEEVCAGRTGHAEAVDVTFDPDVITYAALLDVFWACHDPTERGRQGPDVGAQYRSVIFFHDEGQRVAAEMSRAARERSGTCGRPIVTEIEPAGAFWQAEDRHQQYFAKRSAGSQASSSDCARIPRPSR